MSEITHLIGLLLGTEEDWPTAFETLVSRLGVVRDAAGQTHRIATARISIEPSSTQTCCCARVPLSNAT